MKKIKDALEELGNKYSFKCEILLDGLYDNNKITLYETNIKGPFKIDVIDNQLIFLKDKTFNSFQDIEKEILKEKINILSNNKLENVIYNKNANRFIFKCEECNSFGTNKKINKDNGEDYIFTEEDRSNLNIHCLYNQYPCCKICSKDWISSNQINYLFFLEHCKIDERRLLIGSSGGGSVSIFRRYGNIIKL